ncbi:LysR substrate-binding domain-containing protein [Roseovarius sp.]|uniref:LysR substrate-binding domain-containing protein n=1 Tax=Roseovarius sp. TaxID=1486281 RepID=UPI00258000B7|nr:LysR substrate-binding domain-containing protein [Roseovarius sp.]
MSNDVDAPLMTKNEQRKFEMHLPSMRSLIMLEAIGRQGTFRAAAEDLNTTPSAISHRIADLEAALGAPLFTRSGRSVELTAAGREYVRDIRNALGLIASSGLRFSEGAKTIPIRIALHPPFAHSWLAPRMTRLAEAFPDIRFEFIYVERPSEAFSEEVDIAIDWGTEKTSALKGADILIPRVVTLITSPGYIKSSGMDWNIETLRDTRILQTSVSAHEFPLWLEQLGREPSEFDISFRFSSSALLLAAVRNGLGAGLACRNLIAAELSSGALVAPFNEVLETGDCYYLVKMPRMRDKCLSEAIASWFTAEACRA